MGLCKKDITLIYQHLFKEGVLVAPKNATRHPEIHLPNRHIIQTLTSLKSKGFVKEQFAGRHFHWCLTDEGIQFLRQYLHLPAQVVPATMMRTYR